MAETVSVQMYKILNEVDKKAEDALTKSIAKVSRETASKLRSSSPKRTGRYASGWTVKKEGKDGAVVYNSTKPRLTHLLENGHVVRNARGTYGRVSGRSHIKPAETWAGEELQSEIMRALE